MIAGIAQAGIAEPVDRGQAERLERAVQEPDARVVEEAPHDRDGDQRGDHRQEVDVRKKPRARASGASSSSAPPSDVATESVPPTAAK